MRRLNAWYDAHPRVSSGLDLLLIAVTWWVAVRGNDPELYVVAGLVTATTVIRWLWQWLGRGFVRRHGVPDWVPEEAYLATLARWYRARRS